LRSVSGEERATQFERLLRLTDLARFTARFAGKLSGGMKQKLGLCCALLGNPRLLLLDEPGVGVDPISRRELWKMIRTLLSDDVAVLWSTAYLEEAELCDDVMLLNEGRLIFNGTPDDLTQHMKGRCFRLDRIEGNRRQLLTRVLQKDQVLDAVIQGQSLRVVLNKDQQPPPVTELNGGRDAGWEPVKPRFEDAFLDALNSKPPGRSPLAEHLEMLPKDGTVRIEAKDLTKKFGDFFAVRNVNFNVVRGEIFGLLGPNGAGKSTTFKMMCGLLQSTSGQALVSGLDLKTGASKARQTLGYMAQKFSLYGNLFLRYLRSIRQAQR
jgi:ABC-2 type transport system ATP-binding protein